MKKHIVCFGDSNTHGYCADPTDCEDCGNRFNENERWTSLLQNALGDDYLVIEEGLSGRTTVFDAPEMPGMKGLDFIQPCLMTHEPVDLLILMLGTNDTRAILNISPKGIALGLSRLVLWAKATPDVWRNNQPNILVIAPPHILNCLYQNDAYECMGPGCVEKSRQLADEYQKRCRDLGCTFLDAEGIAEFNHVDGMHLTKKGHAALAAKLTALVPAMVK